MRKIANLIFCIVVLSLLFVSASGCNTMQGLGKDIEKGGEKIQEAAE